MGCCCDGKKFLKKLMIAFNFYYWFSGPVCLGLGIWFLLIIRHLEPALDVADFSPSYYLMIGAGGAIMFYGLIGCIAIFNENTCLLGFYFVLLVTSFAAQLASCLKLFLIYDNIESQVVYNLNVSIRYKYFYDADITTSMDNLQQDFACCGVRNSSDWKSSYYHLKHKSILSQGHVQYPSSCCAHEDSATNTTDTCTLIFVEGCASPVTSMVKWFCEIFGWSSFGMGAMQLIGGVLLYCFRTAVS